MSMTRQERRAAERQSAKAQIRADKAANQNTITLGLSTPPPEPLPFGSCCGVESTPEPKAAAPITPKQTFNAATFQVLPCERQEDYDKLLRKLVEAEDPQTYTEYLLVSSMAQHRWLHDRALRLQEECLNPETGHIGRLKDLKVLSLYFRYATINDRAFHTCLNQLAKLRADRKKSEIGFESQNQKTALHKVALKSKEMEYERRKLQLERKENAYRLAKSDGGELQITEQAA